MIERKFVARQQLESELIGFLEKMRAGGEKEIGRNPSSADLIPFFQTYGNACLDAELRERLPFTSVSRGRAAIEHAVRRVIESICKKDGVWRRAVNDACSAVDLGTWITQFGEYDKSAFARPKRMQLEPRLRSYANRWRAEMWKYEAESAERSSEQGAQREPDADVNSADLRGLRRARLVEKLISELNELRPLLQVPDDDFSRLMGECSNYEVFSICAKHKNAASWVKLLPERRGVHSIAYELAGIVHTVKASTIETAWKRYKNRLME
jgi:hypothetical protein